MPKDELNLMKATEFYKLGEHAMMFEILDQLNLDTAEKEWRWQLVKINSHIVIANSADTFKTQKECEANIHLVMLTDYTTPIVELHDPVNNDKLNSMKNYLSQ